jgi:hypothetical protein
MALHPESENLGGREGVFSISNLPIRIVSMNDLSNMTATFKTRSFSGYDRFGATNEWIGACAESVRVQAVEDTRILSIFIGYISSLAVICCIIKNLP